jgi:branched-chain amino acid transport system substrate-binding protein
VTRIFPPLNTTDYSSYVAQIPKTFDGLFSAVGGSGLPPFMKQLIQARGKIPAKKLAGNIFFPIPQILAAVGSPLVGATFAQSTNEDTKSPNAAAYIAALGQAYPNIPMEGSLAKTASSVFTVNYYLAMWALSKAMDQVNGDLSNGQAALHAALAKTAIPDGPYGPVTLDQNRQAISTNYVGVITPPAPGQKVPGIKTILTVPNVSQAFGGTFTATTPAPGRTAPACKKRKLPWQGKESRARFG